MMPLDQALSPNCFQVAMHASPTPVLMIRNAGAEQTIVYANPAFEHLSGYALQELLGHDWSFLYIESDEGNALEALRYAISTRRGGLRTFLLRAKNGARHWLEMHLSPLATGAVADDLHIAAIHDITKARAEHAMLEHRAYHDPLTGLPNRYLLQDRFDMAVRRARRYRELLGVALVDLNGFKLANDTYGHACGDEILREIGKRLTGILRESDTAARLGGDEFVLLLQCTELESSGSIENRIITQIMQPLVVFGNEIVVSCCVGIAYYPDDADSLSDLLRNADAAMYQIKRRARLGRGSVGSCLALPSTDRA